MSELKSVKQSDIMWGHWFTEYYLKSEVDAVIAEKDKELRHHKYKRCLQKAKTLDRDATISNFMIVTEKEDNQKENHKKRAAFYCKWSNKWLEIAEKFKPEVK